jgi:hypothetical protein
MFLLAWTPFVDPITEATQGVVDVWWLTLPLMALLVSMAYKAVRMRTLAGYVRQVLIMTVQIVLAMIAIGIVLGIIAEVVVPYFLT